MKELAYRLGAVVGAVGFCLAVVCGPALAEDAGSGTDSAAADSGSGAADSGSGAADSSTTYPPGMAPGEHAGWAIVDPVTGQQTGGVIVCTPEVCGSGWFAGMRVVLQTTQDPVEAATSPNGIGNVAGYQGGTYNFETGKWTMPGSNGQVLEIPLAYPGADQGGTVHSPYCILNCDPEPANDSSSGSEATGIIGFTELQSVLPDLSTGVGGVQLVMDGAAEKERIELNANILTALSTGAADSATESAQSLQNVFEEAAVDALPRNLQAKTEAALETVRIDNQLERKIVNAASTAARIDITASLGVGDGGQPPAEAVVQNRLAVAQALVDPTVQRIFSVPQAKVTEALARGDVYSAAVASSPQRTNDIRLAQALTSGNIAAAVKLLPQATNRVNTQVALSRALATGDVYQSALAISPTEAVTQRILLANALARGDIAAAMRYMR